MTTFLYRLSRWCAEHAWLVVVIWIVVLLGLGGLNRVLGGNPPSSYVLSGTDSAAAIRGICTRRIPITII